MKGIGFENMREMFQQGVETKKEIEKATENGKNSSNVEGYKELSAREQKLKKLCGKYGCREIDEDTLGITKDNNKEYEIIVSLIKSRAENQRTYVLYEIDNTGYEMGKENEKARFTAAEFEKGANRILTIIQGFEGDYQGKKADICEIISQIEKNRVLKAAPIKDIGFKTTEEIFEDFKNFFIKNPKDPRVGCCYIKGELHVALVQRGQKTIGNIFKELFDSFVGKKNKVKNFQSDAIKKKLVSHDASQNGKGFDFQKTVWKSHQKEMDIKNDKIISFNFSEEDKKLIYERYQMSDELLKIYDVIDEISVDDIGGFMEEEFNMPTEKEWEEFFVEEEV